MSHSNDAKELSVYRALAEFSQNAWQSWNHSLKSSEELLSAVQVLLRSSHRPSDDLVGHIVTTIDSTLYQDCNNSRSSQRRNRVAPSREDLHEFDASLLVLYKILRKLNFEKVYDKIDGSLFCRQTHRVFIFPGYPSEPQHRKGWKFTHGKFVLPNGPDSVPQRILFDTVQHVVHDVDDLLSILHLTNRKRQAYVGLRLCLKGRSNFVYNGPDLVWFSPSPPAKSNLSDVCPSLDPKRSRYGCFRLTLPFTAIARKYSAVYRLGTRKCNQEYCHTYLLTRSDR